MPSKPKPRKKRSGFKVPWTPVLWVLALSNVAFGAQFSPLTKAYRVRIVGADRMDHQRLRGILYEIRGTPSRQVNLKWVESRALENDRIGRASYTQNLFGRGLLMLTPAKLIGRLRGASILTVTERGSIVRAEREIPALPELKLPESAGKLSGLVFAPYEAGRVAELCVIIKKEFPVTPWILEVKERGEISLYTGTRGEVRLGSFDKLNEKLAKLKELLQADPELLNRQDALNLTVPDAPTLDPRGRRSATQ